VGSTHAGPRGARDSNRDAISQHPAAWLISGQKAATLLAAFSCYLQRICSKSSGA
jgi:hypothetical protein